MNFIEKLFSSQEPSKDQETEAPTTKLPVLFQYYIPPWWVYRVKGQYFTESVENFRRIVGKYEDEFLDPCGTGTCFVEYNASGAVIKISRAETNHIQDHPEILPDWVPAILIKTGSSKEPRPTSRREPEAHGLKVPLLYDYWIWPWAVCRVGGEYFTKTAEYWQAYQQAEAAQDSWHRDYASKRIARFGKKGGTATCFVSERDGRATIRIYRTDLDMIQDHFEVKDEWIPATLIIKPFQINTLGDVEEALEYFLELVQGNEDK